jgi:hypothetical protein
MCGIPFDKLIPVAGTLLGVMIGFLLKAWHDSWKEKKEMERLCLALTDELKSNQRALWAKMDIIRQAIEALGKKEILETASVPFIRGMYDNHYSKILSALSAKERNILHVIYARMATIDFVMDGYGKDVAGSTNEELNNVFVRYLTKFRDMKKEPEIIGELIESYLKGAPIDVLRLDMSIEELKKAGFKPPGS